jgi:uncharacterized protein YndB with AHSA1/START domain
MRNVLVLVAVFVVLILGVILVGYALPERHTAAAEASFRQPPAAIWEAITGYSKFPEWRKAVSRVEPLPLANGLPAWKEFDSHGNAIPFQVVESVAPQRLVTRIADPHLPFGGTWTYEITPTADGGSRLRITENGEIHNPIFRFVSRYVMGYRAMLETYLGALGEKFGETVVVTDPAQK